MPIEALGIAFMHSLLGAGDARRVMFISIGFQWLLFLPLAYLVGPVLGLGLLGIWILMGGSRALQSVTFLMAWKAGRWRHIRV